MKNLFNFLKIFILLNTICIANIFSQPELLIKYNQENYSLARYLSLLEDKYSQYTINEVTSDSFRNKFVYYNVDNLNLKFTNSTYWARFIIVDSTSDKNPYGKIKRINNWVLIRNEPLIDNVELYYKNINDNENEYIKIKSGSLIPNKEKLIKTYEFIASFPVIKNVQDTLYLKVKTRSQFILSFDILTSWEYIKSSSYKYMFDGLLFGILFLLISINIMFYFSVKDKTYLYYVFYILSYFLTLFAYKGYFFELFGKIFSRDHLILPLASLTLGSVFWLLLTREFLLTKKYFPKVYKLLTLTIPLAPIFCFFTFALYLQYFAAVTVGIILLEYILGFVVSILAIKKGINISKYYLLALIGLSIGIFITYSTRNNILPIHLSFWTLNAASLGVLWEAIVLGGSIGYRFNILRVQKDREKLMIRTQIAADLHDEIGSNLSAIALQSQMLIKSDIDNDKSKKELGEIVSITKRTTNLIRDIVWFINPMHDKSEDLMLRMKEIASKLFSNINYTFFITNNNERIFDYIPDLNKRKQIFLIYKESLNNIIKHSEAKNVNISFLKDKKFFEMEIKDDGKGFNENEVTLGEGLKNLKYRAEKTGAQIVIISEKDKGTIIKVKYSITQ